LIKRGGQGTETEEKRKEERGKGTRLNSSQLKKNGQVSPQYHPMSYGAQQDKLCSFSSKNLTGPRKKNRDFRFASTGRGQGQMQHLP